MVEISLSGSGEGRGRATSPPTLPLAAVYRRNAEAAVHPEGGGFALRHCLLWQAQENFHIRH